MCCMVDSATIGRVPQSWYLHVSTMRTGNGRSAAPTVITSGAQPGRWDRYGFLYENGLKRPSQPLPLHFFTGLIAGQYPRRAACRVGRFW